MVQLPPRQESRYDALQAVPLGLLSLGQRVPGPP